MKYRKYCGLPENRDAYRGHSGKILIGLNGYVNFTKTPHFKKAAEKITKITESRQKQKGSYTTHKCSYGRYKITQGMFL
jgi:hypothetical protein